MNLEQLIAKALSEQGILGVLVLVLIYMLRQYIGKLFTLIENNTKAFTETSSALYELKDSVKKCEK